MRLVVLTFRWCAALVLVLVILLWMHVVGVLGSIEWLIERERKVWRGYA